MPSNCTGKSIVYPSITNGYLLNLNGRKRTRQLIQGDFFQENLCTARHAGNLNYIAVLPFAYFTGATQRRVQNQSPPAFDRSAASRPAGGYYRVPGGYADNEDVFVEGAGVND